MRLAEVTITDTFGTHHARFRPGTVTAISGANGSGKSSILKALCHVFAGGSDPSVIRKGAQKSVIDLKLDDGTTITKTTAPVKPRKGATETESIRYRTEVEILDAAGQPIPAPQSFINELSDILAVDPAQILRIDTNTTPGKKALADLLARLIKIEFSPEEVAAAAAYISYERGMAAPSLEMVKVGDCFALAEKPTSPLDLDGLKKVLTYVTEARRRIGIVRDETDGTVSRLQKSLPGDPDTDHTAALSNAEDYRRAVEKAIADTRAEIEATRAKAVLAARATYAEETAAINSDIDARIRQLEQERQHCTAAAMARHNEAKGEADQVATDALAALDAESRLELDASIADCARLKELVAISTRAATLREELHIQERAYKVACWKYNQHTQVLERLEKLRLDKLENLPVPGLVVEDGQVYLDGVEWCNVNLARRVEAVLQICTLRAGRLGLLLIDDSEHLDTETRAALMAGLAEAGFQVILARVTDEPLSIEVAE